jgi:hypothetical protein
VGEGHLHAEYSEAPVVPCWKKTEADQTLRSGLSKNICNSFGMNRVNRSSFSPSWVGRRRIDAPWKVTRNSRVFSTGRCNPSCHSEERSDEESTFVVNNKKIQIPRCAWNDSWGHFHFSWRAEDRCDTQDDIGGFFSNLPLKAWFVFAPLLLASCSRAPSFDILGSFFPAWLVCLAVSILLTFLARWVLLRLHIAVVVPILVYPSLTFLFAFALWLIFFR